MSLRYKDMRIWQWQEAAAMNIRQPVNLFSCPRVSVACHTQEVSFQEGEGESQQDMCVHGEG